MSRTETAVRKTVTVARPPEVAFRVFTEEINSWWPTLSHSVGKEDVEEIVFESGAGGRVYERHTDGTEHEWGRVTDWDPPVCVVFTWHPGRADTTAQSVEVRFTPEGEGTRVDLDHTGWDALSERAERTRARYDGAGGWASVLTRYAEAAESGS